MDFHVGPVVKNLSANAGDWFDPSTLHGQLKPCATVIEAWPSDHSLQQEKPPHNEKLEHPN